MVDPDVVGDGVADVDRDSEKRSRELDDVRDREELRRRFDMLLQEVRVGLPGVQVLAAFLLTAPFSQRFGELDLVVVEQGFVGDDDDGDAGAEGVED